MIIRPNTKIPHILKIKIGDKIRVRENGFIISDGNMYKFNGRWVTVFKISGSSNEGHMLSFKEDTTTPLYSSDSKGNWLIYRFEIEI